MNLITFPASTGLPYSVSAAWGIYAPGRPWHLFCLEEDEASCIDIYEPISQFHVAIVQGCPKQCQEWVNRHYKLDPADHLTLDPGTAKACTFTRQKNRLIVIWLSLPAREDSVTIFGAMAHECLHAAYALMDGMGMKPDFANEEWTAYTIQFLMNNYLQSIGHPLPDSP
jgi:hypothetical protein